MTDPHPTSPLNVGIACDFLFEGGAEIVIDNLADAYPGSMLYTAIALPDELPKYPAIHEAWKAGRVECSSAQGLLKLPFLIRALSVYHFYWLYFLSSAFQRTGRHDVVLYSCAAQSKLIRTPPDTPCVVYFHTPTRWLYPGLTTPADVQSIPPLLRAGMRVLNVMLRPLDQLGIRRLHKRPTVWLCNSSYTRDRVKQFYGIDAQVVFPPVDVARFAKVNRQPAPFFLYNGRIAFQKRVDLAIRACHAARKRLVISGKATSPALRTHLEDIVARDVRRDPSLKGLVTFLGRTTDDQLAELFRTCAALIFPPREDFGIAPIEAIGAGVPVIAFGEGGALDYVKEGINGHFFHSQTPEALAQVLSDFDTASFDAVTVASSIPDLSYARFGREMDAIIRNHLAACSASEGAGR